MLADIADIGYDHRKSLLLACFQIPDPAISQDSPVERLPVLLEPCHIQALTRLSPGFPGVIKDIPLTRTLWIFN